MRNPAADLVYLAALVTLLFSIVFLTDASAQSIDLLQVEASFVEDTGFEGCYRKANDDDMIFCSPAQQLHEAEELNNIVVAADGSITLQRDVDGTHVARGSFVSPVIRGPQFTDAQISYLGTVPPGCSLRLEIRPVRDGVPGPWRVVRREGEVNFDATVDSFQYRLIMTSNGTAAPSVSEVGFMADAAAPDAPTGTPSVGAPVTVAAPPIVERAQWGARAAASGSPRGDRWHTIVVHHTASPVSGYKGAASVRGTQSYHMDGRGWNDIAYHFLVGPDGVIYRGRPQDVRGGHCPPNEGRLGVCIIGNYMNDTLDPRAEQSAKQLIAHLCGRYGMTSANVFPHKALRATACPGTDVMRRFDDLKAAVDEALQRARNDATTD